MLLSDSLTRMCDVSFRLLRVDGAGNVGACATMLLNTANNGLYSDPDAWNNAYFQDLRSRALAGDRQALHEPCRYCVSSHGISIEELRRLT